MVGIFSVLVSPPKFIHMFDAPSQTKGSWFCSFDFHIAASGTEVCSASASTSTASFYRWSRVWDRHAINLPHFFPFFLSNIFFFLRFLSKLILCVFMLWAWMSELYTQRSSHWRNFMVTLFETDFDRLLRSDSTGCCLDRGSDPTGTSATFTPKQAVWKGPFH